MTTCQAAVAKVGQGWDAAIHHQFLKECASCTVTEQQFNTWLIQDYLFVKEFVRFAASVLASAPDEHQIILLDGLAALKDELQWFCAKAAERSLDTTTEPQPACLAYRTWLQALGDEPYAVKAAAFWAIEAVYNQAWQAPGAMPAPYTEFADRWGNTGFSEYVKQLERQADEALGQASSEDVAKAERKVAEVAELEVAFWNMAYYTQAQQ